jgi:MFS superfamily sulfate permease-like transporter
MFNSWMKDFKSSLVVFLVALPLCLGIALASNAPLSAGLYAGIIGGIVVGSLSGSSISVSGPAAGLTVIVINAIYSLGSFEAFTLALLLSGILQIIFSLLKGGAIGDYFPTSVIKGMLAAIGIILILKQLPHAVGFDKSFMGDESFLGPEGGNTFTQLLSAFMSFHPGAVIVAIISLVIMKNWEKAAEKDFKFFKLIPGALIAVLLSILTNYVFQQSFPNLVISGDHLVNLPFSGGFSDFFSGIKFPNWNHLENSQIYIVAVTLAIVGSLESLLSVDAADKIDEEGRITDKNRELLAQGCGNLISGFIGGLPITAVIVRTSANASAGAKSKLSAVLHGVWLFLCVVLIPSLLNLIPLSALAAVLLLVGYKLTKPALIKNMYNKGWNQFIPFAATILAILFTDLLVGIIIGMIVGFVFVFKSNMHKSMVMVKEDNLFLIRFYKDVSFLQKAGLLNMLKSIPVGASVIIDGSNNVFIDDDIIDVIEDFTKRGKTMNINVILKKSSLALCPLFKEVTNGTN